MLWSKAACDAAGEDLPALQDRLIGDIADLLADGGKLLAHVLRQAEDGAVYLCTGDETREHWLIFVQLARYQTLAPSQDGAALQVPETIEGPDNEVFAPYDELAT